MGSNDAPVSLRYYTDPACPWSWALEPCVRKLIVQFGDQLRWTFVMGGLARDFAGGLPHGVSGRDPAPPTPVLPSDARAQLVEQWLRVADETGAPLDPLLWTEGGLRSSYPACMAMKAAADQAPDGGARYLRRLREAILCERRQLDHLEALVGEGRAAELDVERLRIDLRSHAITEAFGADLEDAKVLAAEAGEPESGEAHSQEHSGAAGVGPCSRGAGDVPLPSIVMRGPGGEERRLLGLQRYETFADALSTLGASPSAPAPPSVGEIVSRFGRVTAREVELISDLPAPSVGAELYRLAEQWKVRITRTPTGPLWQDETH
jgi:predicted DsbA family dithiol-disulfide isomerase